MDGHVCGDVEAEKVLFATRRGVWQSVQNERVRAFTDGVLLSY